MSASKHVVVVGAGAGGLSTALALSREGHQVAVLERDTSPLPANVEAAAVWDRPGTPQFHHSHVFMPRVRKILLERFPDVYQALLDTGAPERYIGEGMFQVPPGDERARELVVLPCRRTVYEWVLRRTLEGEANVDIRTGVAVDGVIGTGANGRAPRVTGVRLASGEVIDADVVVATTGRRGDVPAWLRTVGVEVPETVHEAGIAYFSRFYRLTSENLPEFGFRVGRRAGVGFLGYEADNRTFSVTMAVDPSDRELRRHLGDDARYDATGRAIPELAPLLAPEVSEPITKLHVHGGLINRLRQFQGGDGGPLVERFFAVGDAYMVTNPVYARGCTVPLIQATLLADAMAASPDDPVAWFRAYEAGCAREIVPWFHLSVLFDQFQQKIDDGSDFIAGPTGMVGSATDADVALAVARTFCMLDTPDVLASDPRVMQAFSPAPPDASTRRRRPDTGPTVTREELLAVTT